MKVSQAMHQGVEWVSPDTTLTDLARLMQKHDIGCIPIGENDRLVGMVTDRDIVCRGLANGKDPASCTARDVMTRGITYCSEEQELSEAIRVMEEKRIRRLPVLNSKKRMVGILSLGDVSGSGDNRMSGEVLSAVSAHHH